jgi:phospholipase C
VRTPALFALAVCTTLAACSSNAPRGVFVPAADHTIAAAKTPIQHVLFVIQENRSFNNLFFGYPGAKTAKYGYDTKGHRITVRPRDLGAPWDLGHASYAFFTACDGQGSLPGTDCKMDGWNDEGVGPGAPHNAPYSYVPRDQIAPYWTIARQYVLADRTFASNLDGSFVAHQFSVAAYSSGAVDFPLAAWGCEGGDQDTVRTLTKRRVLGHPIVACFDNATIASEADAAGISWRFYAGAISGDGGLWSSYQADDKIYNGPDWKADVRNPPASFLKDVSRGELANITWITPTFSTSDHPGVPRTDGPAWVASVVNAIGESKFWDSTAIFIMWDDWGGLFDPVKPPYEDYAGLGFRVPLIVVSPYAKRGSVTHTQYETASVLRFIEDNFGLQPLARSDARANDPADDSAVMDYHAPPRKFKKIPGSKPADYWLRSQSRLLRDAGGAAIIGDD